MPRSCPPTLAARVAAVLSALVATFVLATGTAAAATVLVDAADSTADGGGCGTAGNACDTIAAGVTAANPGDTVSVAGGTYAEDVTVSKALTLQGAGASTTTIRGPIGGSTATVRVSASNVTVDGFTITRAGNNTTDWNDPNLNVAGVAIQGQALSGIEIRNSRMVGNRTGIDVNHSNGASIHDNDIVDNRTGLILRNQTDGMSVLRNSITGNWTVGVLFLDASGGTNTPLQQATGSTFSRNDISGNWYGQVVDRQAGGALPAAGTNAKDLSGNWLGTTTPTVSTAESAEPGYAAQIPVAYGGTATAPGGQPHVLGAASANVDLTPMLGSGTDSSPAVGFQPGPLDTLTVTTQGAQVGGTGRLQEAVDLAVTGAEVRALAGTYAESVTVAKSLELLGANAGTSPNDPVTPVTANAARGAESTIAVTGDAARAVSVGAPDVTVDGFRFVNTGATSAGVQMPLVGAGVNFGGAAPGIAVVNNVFDGISRTAVYFNGPSVMDGAEVDDNRVVNPTRPSGCGAGGVAPSACGHQLFNLWMTDDLSFQRNVVLAAPGNGDRVRVLNVNYSSATQDASVPVLVADNTVRDSCTYTCFALTGGVTNAVVSGNDVAIDVGNAVQLHSTWTGGDVTITENRFSTPNDFAVAVDNAGANLSGLSVTRNAFTGGGVRNAAAAAVDATCNWWGAAPGPVGAQNQGPVTTSPFLGSSDLAGPCPALPPAPPAPPAPADTDGDGIADVADCAPFNGSAPSKIGTDANCDGIADEAQQPPVAADPPAPTPTFDEPSGNPAPSGGQPAPLGDTPVAPVTGLDLGGVEVFAPSADEPTRRVPVVDGDTVVVDRQAANRGTTQTLLALTSPDEDVRATVRQTVKIGDRTFTLPVQRLVIPAGSSEPVKLPLTRQMRRALRQGRDVQLTLTVVVVGEDGTRRTETRSFTIEAEPKRGGRR